MTWRYKDCKDRELKGKQLKDCKRDKDRQTIFAFFCILFIGLFVTVQIFSIYNANREIAIINGDGFSISISQNVITVNGAGNPVSSSPILGTRYKQTFETTDPNIGDITFVGDGAFNTNLSYVWSGIRSAGIVSDSDNSRITFNMGGDTDTTFYNEESFDTSFYYYADYIESVDLEPYAFINLGCYALDNNTGDWYGTAEGGRAFITIDLLGSEGNSRIGTYGGMGEGEFYVNYTENFHAIGKWGAVVIQDVRALCERALENHTVNTGLFNSSSDIRMNTAFIQVGNGLNNVGEYMNFYVDDLSFVSKPSDYILGENWVLSGTDDIVTGYIIETSLTATLLNDSFDFTNNIINDEFVVSIFDYLTLSSIRPTTATIFESDLDYVDFIDLEGETLVGGATLRGLDASTITKTVQSDIIPLQIDSTLGEELEYEFEVRYLADAVLINGNSTHAESSLIDLNSQDFIVSLAEFLIIE